MRFVPGGRVSGGAGLGAVLALALAGCTGAAEPIVTELPTASPSLSTSASASPAPSATALTDAEVLALMPDGAERTDLFGAMVTAQFFLEQYATMFHTGDTRIWEALSAEGCGYCADALANAERVRDEGWTARGGEITVDTGRTQAAMTGDAEASVLMTADLSAGVLEGSSGAETSPTTARKFEYGVAMVNDGARWFVVEVVGEQVDP